MRGLDFGFVVTTRCACLLIFSVVISACAQKGAVEGFADWEHGLQGGVIAGPLLPPPGFDRPYPKVGRVPQKTVALPSPDARKALSEKLIEQRNLAHYIAVKDGALALPLVPASPSAARTMKRQPVQTASATMAVASQSVGSDRVKDNTPVTAPQLSDTAGLPLPEVTRHAPDPIRRGDIPSIPNSPPTAPQFPGFMIPRTSTFVPPVAPRFSLADAPGKLIRFPKASDMLDEHEHTTIDRLSGGYRPGRPVTISGFGDAVSLAPADQTAAVRLAILRARRVAVALVRRGVSQTDILLQAMPIGQGVRVLIGHK